MKAHWLPHRPYIATWQAMRDFTEARTDATPDELWLVEHDPVYTLGRAGKPEHILNPGGIPVVQCDRGGQVTYHGPGQLTAYCLVDLRRHGLFVKEYVALLEDVLIALLDDYGIPARRLDGAPGVYVDHAGSQECADAPGLAKIGALGIRLRNGCAYHGLALNVNMDTTPFAGINPCGYQGMPVTDMAACGASATVRQVGDRLTSRLLDVFIPHTPSRPSPEALSS